MQQKEIPMFIMILDYIILIIRFDDELVYVLKVE